MEDMLLHVRLHHAAPLPTTRVPAEVAAALPLHISLQCGVCFCCRALHTFAQAQKHVRTEHPVALIEGQWAPGVTEADSPLLRPTPPLARLPQMPTTDRAWATLVLPVLMSEGVAAARAVRRADRGAQPPGILDHTVQLALAAITTPSDPAASAAASASPEDVTAAWTGMRARLRKQEDAATQQGWSHFQQLNEAYRMALRMAQTDPTMLAPAHVDFVPPRTAAWIRERDEAGEAASDSDAVRVDVPPARRRTTRPSPPPPPAAHARTAQATTPMHKPYAVAAASVAATAASADARPKGTHTGKAVAAAVLTKEEEEAAAAAARRRAHAEYERGRRERARQRNAAAQGHTPSPPALSSSTSPLAHASDAGLGGESRKRVVPVTPTVARRPAPPASPASPARVPVPREYVRRRLPKAEMEEWLMSTGSELARRNVNLRTVVNYDTAMECLSADDRASLASLLPAADTAGLTRTCTRWKKKCPWYSTQGTHIVVAAAPVGCCVCMHVCMCVHVCACARVRVRWCGLAQPRRR
jgi:hypothetical protein